MTTKLTQSQKYCKLIGQLGAVLAIGILLKPNKSKGDNTVIPGRFRIQDSIRRIIECFDQNDRWTPAQLVKQTLLSKYQVKTALRMLVRSGILRKSGSTTSIQYFLTKDKSAAVSGNLETFGLEVSP